MVVPSDLHLPQEAQAQKYAAHMLGLCFYVSNMQWLLQRIVQMLFRFSCHNVEKDEKQGMIFGRFCRSGNIGKLA